MPMPRPNVWTRRRTVAQHRPPRPPGSRRTPRPSAKRTRRKKTRAAGLIGSRVAISFAIAALLASSAPAAPAGGPQVFQFALQNGMQVVVIPDHRAPVVTQMIWFKVGGVDDPPGLSGLAHFFEHMMFRGTKQTPGDAFSRTLARNGGEDNAFTTHDYTAFYEQIAKNRLPLVMSLEADRLANLDLSDGNIAPERDVVLEER